MRCSRYRRGDEGIPDEIEGVYAKRRQRGTVVRRLPATTLTAASAEMKRRNGSATGVTFEADFFKVTRNAAGSGGARQGGERYHRTGIFMLKSIRLVEDKSIEDADQRVEQRSNCIAVNLAQLRAELSYLNRLEERRETNVASLKRLKEARDALMNEGSEVARISTSRRF